MAKRHIPTHARITAKLILAAGAVLLMSQLPAYSPALNAPPKLPAPAAPMPVDPPPPPAPDPPRPAFEVNSALALERPLRHGEYAWAAQGVPPGRLWVHVDIGKQVIRVIQGTSEIGRAIILYGADDKPTPLGQFTITEKDRHHVSNLYDVPMPWMLRLTDDGIAIHGSTVEYGVATHGCIGVPDEFAALLFAEAKLGTPVVITRGQA